jgi:hypothetical protein
MSRKAKQEKKLSYENSRCLPRQKEEIYENISGSSLQPRTSIGRACRGTRKREKGAGLCCRGQANGIPSCPSKQEHLSTESPSSPSKQEHLSTGSPSSPSKQEHLSTGSPSSPSKQEHLSTGSPSSPLKQEHLSTGSPSSPLKQHPSNGNTNGSYLEAAHDQRK